MIQVKEYDYTVPSSESPIGRDKQGNLLYTDTTSPIQERLISQPSRDQVLLTKKGLEFLAAFASREKRREIYRKALLGKIHGQTITEGSDGLISHLGPRSYQNVKEQVMNLLKRSKNTANHAIQKTFEYDYSPSGVEMARVFEDILQPIFTEFSYHSTYEDIPIDIDSLRLVSVFGATDKNMYLEFVSGESIRDCLEGVDKEVLYDFLVVLEQITMLIREQFWPRMEKQLDAIGYAPYFESKNDGDPAHSKTIAFRRQNYAKMTPQNLSVTLDISSLLPLNLSTVTNTFPGFRNWFVPAELVKKIRQLGKNITREFLLTEVLPQLIMIDPIFIADMKKLEPYQKPLITT